MDVNVPPKVRPGKGLVHPGQSTPAITEMRTGSRFPPDESAMVKHEGRGLRLARPVLATDSICTHPHRWTATMSNHPPQRLRRRLLPALGLLFVVSSQAGVPADGIDADVAATFAASIPQTTTRASVGMTWAKRHAALLERAMTEGSVPVIVRFRTPDTPQIHADSVQRRAAVSAAQ